MVEVDTIILSLNRLRIMTMSYEYDIYGEIVSVFDEDNIPYKREVKIGSRMRIDFLCGDIGIEVKKGKPDRKKTENQIVRYCGSGKIGSLILVIERSLFSHLSEVYGKPVRYVALNKLWGLSL